MAEIAEAQEGNSTASGGSEDNPFSFKRFVKRSSNDGAVKTGGKREKKKKTRAEATSDMPFPEEGWLFPTRFPCYPCFT